LTNVYKTSITTTSLEMELIDVPAAVMPITPRRRTVPAAVSNISDMQPLPSAPVTERTYKNAVVPLVANVGLVAEIEKLHVKVDAVSVDIARVFNIMEEVGKAEPVAPEVVAPVSVPIVSNFMDVPTLIWKIEDEGRKTRDYIKHLAIVMALFIFVMTIVVVSAVYVTVYMLTEPEPCESVPGQCPSASLPSKWDALTACARIMLTNEEY
jgi:hypothetical protein